MSQSGGGFKFFCCPMLGFAVRFHTFLHALLLGVFFLSSGVISFGGSG